MSLKEFLYSWQKLEWDKLENLLDENCEIEMAWLGMKFNKDEYFQLLKTVTEEHPWTTNKDIIDEINFENHTITTFFTQWPSDEPPDFEVWLTEWSDTLIVKSTIYNCREYDMNLSKNWIKSFQKDQVRLH